MDKIRVSLKEEVKKELLRERQNILLETLLPLSEIKDKELIPKQLGEITLKLISNGYSPEEITLVIEQDMFGGLRDENGKFNLWNTIMGGGKSQFWESVLVWLFSKVLGIGQATSQDLAVVLADYNPLHILNLFKGYDACVQEIGGDDGLGMAIAEMFINKSQFQGKERKPLGKDFFKISIRNLAAEAVRESDLDKKLAEKICGYIWNEGGKAEPKTDERPADETPPEGNKPQQPANPRDN